MSSTSSCKKSASIGSSSTAASGPKRSLGVSTNLSSKVSSGSGPSESSSQLSSSSPASGSTSRLVSKSSNYTTTSSNALVNSSSPTNSGSASTSQPSSSAASGSTSTSISKAPSGSKTSSGSFASLSVKASGSISKSKKSKAKILQSRASKCSASRSLTKPCFRSTCAKNSSAVPCSTSAHASTSKAAMLGSSCSTCRPNIPSHSNEMKSMNKVKGIKTATMEDIKAAGYFIGPLIVEDDCYHFYSGNKGSKRLVVKMVNLKACTPRYRANMFNYSLKIECYMCGVDDDKVKSPYFIKVFQIFEVDSTFIYFFMEEVPGKSLYLRIFDNDTIAPNTARNWTRQIVEAVKKMNDIGVAHRFLKLQHILFDRSDQVKIAGWSKAVPFWNPEHKKALLQRKERRSRKNLHLPPECFRFTYDPSRVDIWSVGVIMVSMQTRRYPFNAKSKVKFSAQWRHFVATHKMNKLIRNALNKAFFIDPVRRINPKNFLKLPYFKESEKDICELTLKSTKDSKLDSRMAFDASLHISKINLKSSIKSKKKSKSKPKSISKTISKAKSISKKYFSSKKSTSFQKSSRDSASCSSALSGASDCPSAKMSSASGAAKSSRGPVSCSTASTGASSCPSASKSANLSRGPASCSTASSGFSSCPSAKMSSTSGAAKSSRGPVSCSTASTGASSCPSASKSANLSRGPASCSSASSGTSNCSSAGSELESKAISGSQAVPTPKGTQAESQVADEEELDPNNEEATGNEGGSVAEQMTAEEAAYESQAAESAAPEEQADQAEPVSAEGAKIAKNGI